MYKIWFGVGVLLLLGGILNFVLSGSAATSNSAAVAGVILGPIAIIYARFLMFKKKDKMREERPENWQDRFTEGDYITEEQERGNWGVVGRT